MTTTNDDPYQDNYEDYSYYVMRNYNSGFAAISSAKAIIHKITRKDDEYQQAFSRSDAYKAVVHRGMAQLVTIILLLIMVIIELPFIGERFANLGNISQVANLDVNASANAVNELSDHINKNISGYFSLSMLFGLISIIVAIVESVKYSKFAKRANVTFENTSKVFLANVISCIIAPAIINYILTNVDLIAFNVVHLVIFVALAIGVVLVAFYMFGGAISGVAAEKAYNNSVEGKRANLNKQLDKVKRAEKYHGKAASTSAMGNYHKQTAKDYAKERSRIQDKLNQL